MISQLKDGVKFTLDNTGTIYIRKTYRKNIKIRLRAERMYYHKSGNNDLHYYLDKSVRSIIR